VINRIPAPSRLKASAGPLAWLCSLFGVAVNVAIAVGHLVTGQWPWAGFHAVLSAACGALAQATVYVGHRHELWVTKMEADIGSSQHTERMLAKQGELINRDFVAATAAGERRH
jgi:hypothetical protein